MNKVVLFIFCMCICYTSFTQHEMTDIRGAIKLSNSEAQNPVDGTIRWTGQDFEGFDGTEWKSLTCCSSTEGDAILNCPAQNFTLTDCNLFVNWTHPNPESTTVSYDIRINGVDLGTPVSYPATSNTIDVCSALGINSGSGTFELQLIFWYDGDFSTRYSTASCTMAYDFGDQVDNVFTFAQIRAAGRSANGYADAGIDYADAHLAELLYMNPEACNWHVDVANERITILPCEEPTGSIAYMPAPSGGNDAAMIENFINANSGKNVVGTGGTYQLSSTVDVNVPVRIFDIPTRMTGSISTAYKVNSADVEFHNCLIDADNSASFLIGWNVGPTAHRFVLTKSGVKDMYRIGEGPAAGVWIRGGRDFKIACNSFENLLMKTDPANDTQGESSSIVRPVWSQSTVSGAQSPGGYIVNNYANNIHTNEKTSQGDTTDPEFFCVQGYDGTAGRVKILANRCVNAGKRFTKIMHPDVFVASNFFHWKDRDGPFSRRVQTSIVNCQIDATDVRAINNRFKVDAEARYGAWFRASPHFSDHRFENLHFDYNDIELVDTPPESFYANGIEYSNKADNSPDSRNKLTNCSAIGNYIHGPGGTNHYFYFGPGYDDDASSLDIDLSGNTIAPGTPIHGSIFKGSSGTPLPQ